MSDVKLLPCPFCGNRESLYRNPAHGKFQEYCDKCGARGPERHDLNEATAAWNTRTAPALTPKQAAAEEMFNALTTALAAEQTRLYSLPPSDDYETSVAKDGCSARIGKYRAALAKAGQP